MTDAPTSKNLVVLNWDGKGSGPPFYQVDEPAAFDLLVFDFTGKAEAPAIPHTRFFSKKTEMKGQIYGVIADYLRERRLDYDYIALIDDDIEITSAGINRCFDLGHRLGLASFAPSLTHDSHYSWANTLTRPSEVWHRVDCTEIMMPFYRFDLFLAAAPFYPETISGYGLDRFIIMMLQHLMGLGPAGVIDTVSARHNRPVTSAGKTYSNGRTAWGERKHIRKLGMRHVAAHHPRQLGKLWYMRCFADARGPARFWGPWACWPLLWLRGKLAKGK